MSTGNVHSCRQSNTLLNLCRLIYPNGDQYEGAFSNNQKHGRGRFAWAGGDVYEGLYHKDRRYDERGRMTLADGSSFEGIFVNDQLV